MTQPQPQAGLVPNELMAAGLKVFPCNQKKEPAIPKGSNWQTIPPENQTWPAPLIGVQIPPGTAVIDLDTYKDVTRQTVEAAIGCTLQWDQALLQTTTRGGQHYAFRVDWPVRQGSNLHGLEGFDTRVEIKGYICTGSPDYTPCNAFGVLRLGQPDSLPRLPDAAREALEDVKPAMPTTGTASARPPDMDDVIEALRHIPPDCGRTVWLRVGMALKTQTEDVTLFDQWSSGQLTGVDTPHNYVAEHIQAQWPGFKPGGDDKIGIGTLFYEAQQAGWKPPAGLDTAAVFGFTAAATYERGPGFQLTRAGDLKVQPLDWLVTGLFERDSLMAVLGDPGTGKSFWALDLACCIAANKPHHGRTVKPGAVVYVAGEGHNGITRRLKAWSIKNLIRLADMPLYVSNMPAAMTNVESLSTLMGAIKRTGDEPALVIFDTLARNFGPADENSTPDMNTFVGHCDQIRVAYGCTVALVHHTGHGDKSRGRGSSVLPGAVDTSYLLTKDGDTIRIKATKVKDGPLPEPFAFGFRTVGLGMKNDDGTAATSAVLQPVSVPDKPTPAAGKNQIAALSILNDLTRKDNGDDPATTRANLDDWRHACVSKGMPRQSWYDVKDALQTKRLIKVEGECVTTTGISE